MHCIKSVRIRRCSGLCFPAFGLNTERCGVSFRIQFECGNSDNVHFSRSYDHWCIQSQYQHSKKNRLCIVYTLQMWNFEVIEAVVQRCFFKKYIFEDFAKFTGKHLCQVLFLMKLQSSGTGVFQWSFKKFLNHLFL